MVVEASYSRMGMYFLNVIINGSILGTCCLFDEKQMKANDVCVFIYPGHTSFLCNWT